MNNFKIILFNFIKTVLCLLFVWFTISTIFYSLFGMQMFEVWYIKWVFIVLIVILNCYILMWAHKEIDPIIDDQITKIFNKLKEV